MASPIGKAGIGIGVVGHGFMGKAHALAWRVVDQVFALPARPELIAIAGRDIRRAAKAAGELGFSGATDDWTELLAREDIDVVDICTPVSAHAEIARAALAAGKHVLCEKPLAMNREEASALGSAAAEAAARGTVAMVGYNYRRIPALALARRFCSEGRIGELRHVRARYLQDWLSDAEAPWTWRLDADEAGAGALADLGSHLIDLVHYVTGRRLAEVQGNLQTFVDTRPSATDSCDSKPEQVRVTVDDACAFSGRADDGLLTTFEVTRCALGRKNQMLLELDGTAGSIAFNLERLNELQLYARSDPPDAGGFRTIVVTEPVHPYLAGWWPPGHTLGWDDTFVHQARDFVLAVCNGEPYAPDFADGLYVQAVIEAIQASAKTGTWEQVDGRPIDDGRTPDGAVRALGELHG